MVHRTAEKLSTTESDEFAISLDKQQGVGCPVTV